MHSRKLTIFEGPDGSGKTTAAIEYAKNTGAKYVHFSDLPGVGDNLGRMYVEAMLPALLGYQDVVFDRCWISEIPYGIAFRGNKNRLGFASQMMLERLAMRCGAVVIHCRPPWEKVKENYLKRRKEEYLENDDQLKVVYDLYGVHRTELPELTYDFTTNHDIISDLSYMSIDKLRMPQHPIDVQSAGNWGGKFVLIGEKFAHQKSCDPFYQWPFASFSKLGCSQWLTEQLIKNDIHEKDLLWINSDQDLSVLYGLNYDAVIALGNEAYGQLYKLKIMASVVPHPQHHKRFNFTDPYQLFDHIGE